jgi:DNA-binding GntR family transcriptional regulator
MSGAPYRFLREAGEASPETLASTVYGQLRRDIVRAAFQPGQKLLLRDLCERYAIGLAPLREALNRLASDELVVQTDQRGFRVAPVSAAELDDLVSTRCRIEAICLRESIALGDAGWEEEVTLAFRRLSGLRRATGARTPALNPAWERAHQAFHATLLAASPSLILRNLCGQLSIAADRYRHLARLPRDAAARPVEDEHRALLDAALSRDAEAATALLAAHYRRTAEMVRRALPEA